MAKRPPIGRCVHCLAEDVDRTWDHIFPLSWYPDTTPGNLSKWKVPACFTCNNRLGRIEQDLLRAMAMTLDPKNPASASVTQSVLRSMSPHATQDVKEKMRRERTGRKFTAALIQGDAIPEGTVDVNLTTKGAGSRDDRIAVPIAVELVHGWLEKTVRGMLFHHGQCFVENSHEIDFMPFVTQEGLDGFESMGAGYSVSYVNGPGIAVRMGVGEDGVSSFFLIELWKQIYMGAGVHPKGIC